MRQRRKIWRIGVVVATLLVCFALPCPLTVHAAEGTTDITKEDFDVDVDIVWGAMSFTYSPQHELWDPATHTYQTMGAGWTIRGNDITVTNVGRRAIRADFTATVAEGITTVTANFKTEAQAKAVAPALSVELYCVDYVKMGSQCLYFVFCIFP